MGVAVDPLSLQNNLGTNTCSVALLIGEKAADLLCEELGTWFSNISCSGVQKDAIIQA